LVFLAEIIPFTQTTSAFGERGATNANPMRMAEKKNRCWPGYEPVKGKPQHSQGSCRPKSKSKLSDSEKKFRAKRKKQLDSWKKKHPGTRRSAAQHLSAPSTKKKSIPRRSAKQAA
jgi:hypothetical protein